MATTRTSSHLWCPDSRGKLTPRIVNSISSYLHYQIYLIHNPFKTDDTPARTAAGPLHNKKVHREWARKYFRIYKKRRRAYVGVYTRRRKRNLAASREREIVTQGPRVS